MRIWHIYRRDRYLRASDHVSFLQQGYPAARFTEPNENFAHEHQDVRVENGQQFGDLIEFVDFDYVTRVAKVLVSEIEPPPAEVVTARTDYVAGVAKRSDGLLILLDPGKTLVVKA